MMPSLGEIVSSLTGALRLLGRDRKGLDDFNLTEDGFWASFFAMVPSIPLLALTAIAFRGNAEVGNVALASRTSANLILQWVSFAALMMPFTSGFDLGHRYMRFVTVYNWCSVVAAGCTTAPALLYLAGALSMEGTLFAMFFVFLAMLAYFWYAVREALETNGFIAAGVLFVDFTLNVAIEWIFGLHRSFH